MARFTFNIEQAYFLEASSYGANYLFESGGYLYKSMPGAILRERDQHIERLSIRGNGWHCVFGSIFTIRNNILYVVEVYHNPKRESPCMLELISVNISGDKMEIISSNVDSITVPISFYSLYHTTDGITIKSDKYSDFIYNIVVDQFENSKLVLEPISYELYPRKIHVKSDDICYNDKKFKCDIVAYDIINDLWYLIVDIDRYGVGCVIPGTVKDQVDIKKYMYDTLEYYRVIMRETALKFCD